MKKDIKKWFFRELKLAACSLTMLLSTGLGLAFFVVSSASEREAMLWLGYWVMVSNWASTYAIKSAVDDLKRSVEKK